MDSDEAWQHGDLCWPRSCSTRNYDRFESYSMVGGARSRAPIWRVLWRRIKKEKRRMFSSSNSSSPKFNYDPSSYSQNFEDRGSINVWADQDDISRSFSARFAVSSRFFQTNSLIV